MPLEMKLTAEVGSIRHVPGSPIFQLWIDLEVISGTRGESYAGVKVTLEGFWNPRLIPAALNQNSLLQRARVRKRKAFPIGLLIFPLRLVSCLRCYLIILALVFSPVVIPSEP